MHFLLSTFYFLLSKKVAQAILSLIFLIGGIVVLAGLTIAFLANSFINSTFGFREAQRAEAVASSGAYDAMLRLARGKDISGSYTMPIGDLSADVLITQDSPSAGLVTIVSASTVSRRTRGVRAIVSRDVASGMTSLVSWRANP